MNTLAVKVQSRCSGFFPPLVVLSLGGFPGTASISSPPKAALAADLEAVPPCCSESSIPQLSTEWGPCAQGEARLAELARRLADSSPVLNPQP